MEVDTIKQVVSYPRCVSLKIYETANWHNAVGAFLLGLAGCQLNKLPTVDN